MVKYDYLELLKAIRCCEDKPRYSVIVLMPTLKQAKIVFDEAVCEISNDNEINVHGRGSSCGYSIIYHNSSIMRFSVLREGVRGQRANRIIYDPNIDEDLLREIALPMERPYMEENNGTSRRI